MDGSTFHAQGREKNTAARFVKGPTRDGGDSAG